MSQLARCRRRVFEEWAATCRIGLQDGQEATKEIGPGLRLRIATSVGQQLIQPVQAFGGGSRDPVPTDSYDQIDTAWDVPLGDAPPEDESDVVNFDVHPLEPLDKPVAGYGHPSLAPRPVVLGAS